MNSTEELARKSLATLIHHVFDRRHGQISGITYKDLAARIGRLTKHGEGHARGMGDVLSKMGSMLKDLEGEWGEPIPHIQSLVVLKTGELKGLPDLGIEEFWKDYPEMSLAEKRNRTRIEHRRIADFGSRWNDVLDRLGLDKEYQELWGKGWSPPPAEELFEHQERTARQRQQEDLGSLLSRVKEKSPKPPRSATTTVTVYDRDPDVVAIAKKRAGFRCEVSGCEHQIFQKLDGEPYVEVHHLHPLAKGGLDIAENVACLCPAHHREVHFGAKAEGITKDLQRRRQQDQR